MSIQNNKLPDNPNIEVIKAKQTGLFTNYIYKAIPLAFDESLSYYECLCGLLDYLKNVIIPTLNNNADAVAELQTLYEELRTYVDTYFDNLDVQNEINNKLDNMAESGQLTELISAYLNLKSMLVFDNVENMKQATNLVNGSYARTLGYFAKNDKGGSIYKIRTITTEDDVNSGSIIAINEELVAELIENGTVNVEQFGIDATQNALHNTEQFKKLLLYYKNGGTIKLNAKTYPIAHIELDENLTGIKINGIKNQSILNQSIANDTFIFEFNGSISKLEINDLFLECNGTGGGIQFNNSTATSTGQHGYITLNNVDIRHANKGLDLNAVVYTHVNNCNISLSGTLTSDDFGIQLNGYEYNYFKDTSIQFWVDNITDAPADICAIKGDGVHIAYFDRCEIVKCNGYGYYFTTNKKSNSGVWITNNTIFNVNKPIEIETKNYVSQNIYIKDNQITNESNNYNISFTNKSGTTRLCSGIIISENYLNKNNIVHLDANLSSFVQKILIKDNVSLTSAGYNSYDLNENYVSLTGVNMRTIITKTYRPSSTTLTIYDTILEYNIIPKMPNDNLPNVQVTTNLPVRNTYISREDNDNRYRIRLYFDENKTVSTTTDYTIVYHISTI